MNRLERNDWEHLLPHAGGMCLLDAVERWDAATIHASSAGHARADHPLRGEDGGLHAIHLAEYGAQAMALHGALLDRAAGCEAVRPGVLVSLRDVRLAVEWVERAGGRLDVHAERVYGDVAGAQYVFRVERDAVVLASGRVAALFG
jgi:predicted hotdog family 3-hydroxylacyl-ACP dehydratase